MLAHDAEACQSISVRNKQKKVIFASIGFISILCAIAKNSLLTGAVADIHRIDSDVKLAHRRTQELQTPPVKVAWLLSFPNSGTQFTTDLARLSSHFSTGTNYGNELSGRCGKNYMFDPNFAVSDNGPYRSSWELPMPEEGHLLTKTHCAGFCLECNPGRYITSEYEFISGCASGARTKTSKEFNAEIQPFQKVRYDVNLVKKAIHLIRNPYDNIVANFRYEHGKHKKIRDEQWTYTKDPKGFREWCSDLDKKYLKEANVRYDSDIAKMAKDVPCYGLFYQYVQWHNNAVAITEALNMPRLDIYYEGFHYDIDSYARTIAEFLEFPFVGKPQKFRWNGGYPKYFSDDERVIIANFIRLLSSYETYRLLKQYLIFQV